jgi:hypothetical protein
MSVIESVVLSGTLIEVASRMTKAGVPYLRMSFTTERGIVYFNAYNHTDAAAAFSRPSVLAVKGAEAGDEFQLTCNPVEYEGKKTLQVAFVNVPIDLAEFAGI